MWRVVSWSMRSRAARRVLLASLGLAIRSRLAGEGTTGRDDDDGRSLWTWLLIAVGLAGVVAAAVAYRARQRADAAIGGMPHDTSATPTPPTYDGERTPDVAPADADVAPAATAPSATAPANADVATAPEAPDLAAGEAVIGRRLAVDDLKVVEGIGPKIEQLLNDAGVRTWHDLSATDVDRLRDILSEAGARYRMHDPSTWPHQATLLARGDWDAFAATGTASRED
jgi:predicted flap endonuclease-1-like 5' DNA nuclease